MDKVEKSGKMPVYLDYNATTPVDDEVLTAMLPYFSHRFGNASSRTHRWGWEASSAVDHARSQLASLIQCKSEELVFTSGATEAVNLAIKGVFHAYHRKGKHVVTCTTEHKAVLDVCERLEEIGAEITYVGVDRQGTIDLFALEKAIRTDTVLVSVMWANNETGVVQPMEEIGRICSEKNTLLFSDATQALGKMSLLPRRTGVHLLAGSAHKMYGPKGVGILYVSRLNPRISFKPIVDGGGHENGFRSGTLNVTGIVGFGKAAELAGRVMESDAERYLYLRDKFETGIQNHLTDILINGHPERRLPHVSNVSFKGVSASSLIKSLGHLLAVSTGSACTSASLEPSHVLTGMGVSKELAESSIRFSMGRYTTEKEIDTVISWVVEKVQSARSDNPVWTLNLGT
ncbi:MAG TPA: cysteine desulfurase family protein [Saprospiraceae bacterium]|nr:cysteine desulfurase family protein [Saprospiraceae bacterium]